MPYVDRPLPANFEVIPLAPRKPRKPPGKPKGAVTRITKDLKVGIIEAAVNIGRDGNGTDGLIGFLEDTALHHRKAFCSLLVKLLPMNLAANVTGPTINSIQILSVPTDTHLTSAIEAYLSDRNAAPKPYTWKAEGAAILEEINRARAALDKVEAA